MKAVLPWLAPLALLPVVAVGLWLWRGAGPMICWDRGLFRPLLDPAQGLIDGEIKFELWGYKLCGAFTLVHTGKGTRGKFSGRGSNHWLLIKKRDEPAEQLARPAVDRMIPEVVVEDVGCVGVVDFLTSIASIFSRSEQSERITSSCCCARSFGLGRTS